ncbi:MAG: hypothetical protein ACOZNI_16295 [Myxococcota bacterium]
MLALLALSLSDLARADTIAIPERKVVRLANAPRLAAAGAAHAVCIDGKPCYTFALTPSVPVTFSKLEFNPDGTKRIGSDIAIGGGATFLLARGTYRTDSDPSGERTYTIEDAVPYLLFGIAGQAGMTEALSGEVVYSVSGSGFVGTRFFALMGGYDFINSTPFIGVAANVTGTSISPNAAVVFDAWR